MQGKLKIFFLIVRKPLVVLAWTLALLKWLALVLDHLPSVVLPPTPSRKPPRATAPSLCCV